MKMYGGVDAQIHVFLPSTLVGGEHPEVADLSDMLPDIRVSRSNYVT
jgi:hypothetical protein